MPSPRRTSLQAAEGTVFAGAPFTTALAPGQCVRIMTGAVMPPALDTVVPVELCAVDGAQVTIRPGVLKAGDNRRRRGEDLARGGVALPAGRVLRPADLGLAASLGLDRLTVFRPLKVAVFSTGDEVVPPGQPLAPGQIYDSNRFSLIGALQRLGMDVLDLGGVPDDPALLQATVDRAIAEADAVLTSGGVSMGDADYTRDLLAARGRGGVLEGGDAPRAPFRLRPAARPRPARQPGCSRCRATRWRRW